MRNGVTEKDERTRAFVLTAEGSQGSRLKTTALSVLGAVGMRVHPLCQEQLEKRCSAKAQDHAARCAKPYAAITIIIHTASSSRSFPLWVSEGSSWHFWRAAFQI